VVLGIGSAVLIAIAMVPHLTSAAPHASVILALGLGLWVFELLATPTSRTLEALILVAVGVSGALLNAMLPDSPAFVLAYFAVSGLGLRFVPRRAAALTLLVVAAVDVGIAVSSSRPDASVTTSDLGLAFVLVGAAATRSARAADARSTQLLVELERSRGAQAEAAALAERSRLAREIHDILAHSLSGQVMSLEATRLLAERDGTDPRVLTEIERAHRLAKDGLADTRRAIGALRGDVLPGPDLLGRLVEDAQAGHGLRTSLQVQGRPRPVPAETGLCLYRAAQEALTNTAKHAGRGASARLTLTWSDASVRLVATDERRAGVDHPDGLPAADLPSGGYGLTGLRERAELAGGTLDAGPTSTGFEVVLTLPLPPAGPATREAPA
jgi:signal transduction histidine kinase